MNEKIQYLKAFLKENNITYEQLSELSGIPLNTLKNVFRGKTQNPRIDTMQAIERALGLDNEIPTIPDYTPSEEEKQIFEMIMSMTEEEVEELSNFVDYILSKRK